MDYKQLLQEGGALLCVHISDEAAGQFMAYMGLLLEWNEKMNLTAITDPKDVVCKHFLDSLTVVAALPETQNLRVIDVGTGAGFPGVPLKLARPDLNLTLLDSLNKRVVFLRHVADSLRLQNVSCVHSRAEDSGKTADYRQVYDICVSRAVANLAALAEYCLPFVKVGGKFISMKGPLEGPTLKDEINGAKEIISVLGGEVSCVKSVKIPFTDISHSLIVINKLTQTPAKFPRKANKIAKNPVM